MSMARVVWRDSGFGISRRAVFKATALGVIAASPVGWVDAAAEAEIAPAWRFFGVPAEDTLTFAKECLVPACQWMLKEVFIPWVGRTGVRAVTDFAEMPVSDFIDLLRPSGGAPEEYVDRVWYPVGLNVVTRRHDRFGLDIGIENVFRGDYNAIALVQAWKEQEPLWPSTLRLQGQEVRNRHSYLKGLKRANEAYEMVEEPFTVDEVQFAMGFRDMQGKDLQGFCMKRGTKFHFCFVPRI